MYNYFKFSKLEVKGEPSEAEGIGQYRVTKNVEPSLVDFSYHITDLSLIHI